MALPETQNPLDELNTILEKKLEPNCSLLLELALLTAQKKKKLVFLACLEESTQLQLRHFLDFASLRRLEPELKPLLLREGAAKRINTF